MDYSQNNKFRNILAFLVTLTGDKVLQNSPQKIMDAYDSMVGSGRPDRWQFVTLDEQKLLVRYEQLWLGSGDDKQK